MQVLYKDDIIGYIKKNKLIDENVFDLIEIELQKRVYYYGNHHKEQVGVGKFKFWFRKFIAIAHNLLVNMIAPNTNAQKKGLSSAYFNYDALISEETGFTICRALHSSRRFSKSFGGFRLSLQSAYIDYLMQFKEFKYLLSDAFSVLVREYEENLFNKLRDENYDFLFVPEEMHFHNRLNIKLFKKLGKPTFVLVHGGIPIQYNDIVETRTDYVAVWGDQQLNGYVKNGYDPSRFLVTGHPAYSKVSMDERIELRFGLDKILVLSKSCDGIPLPYDNILSNRSHTIRYLYEVESTLRKVGVAGAHLRFHPSQNIDWYAEYMDLTFWSIDQSDLQESLSKTSLVIGPISTVFVESLLSGVNYLVYEPLSDGKCIFGRTPTLPMDGSDPRIAIARSVDELQQFISARKPLSSELINEFSKHPVDMSPIINAL